MIADVTGTSFAIYRWANPKTTSDYPFLAVAEDGSAILSLGGHRVSFEWGVPEEDRHWLVNDFARTGERLNLDLAMVRHLLHATFRGGAEFGVGTFGRDLGPLTSKRCAQIAFSLA